MKLKDKIRVLNAIGSWKRVVNLTWESKKGFQEGMMPKMSPDG